MTIFVLAGGLFLVALLSGLASSIIAGDRPAPLPSGPQVFEGVVVDGPTVYSPIGEPLAWGYVEIAARHREGNGWRLRTLFREIRGYRDPTIETADGPRKVVFTDPFTQLKDFTIEQAAVETLEGSPEAENVPDWKAQQGPGGFAFKVLGVRRGERLLVVTNPDGSLKEVWKGGRAYQEHRREANAAFTAKLVLFLRALAAASLLGSLVLLAVGLFRG